MNGDRFQRRRLALRERRMCTRCGELPARAGYATCEVCAAVKVVKDKCRRKVADRRKVRLARKLVLVQEAGEILRAEIERLSV